MNANGVPDECEPCEHVTCLKAACKPRDGRFKVRAALVALLPEGDAFTCTLEGLEPHAVTLNDRGRAKTNWTALIDGEHEVCIEECRDAGVCRHPTCG